MINQFAALFRVQPSNPAIQEAAARHMIAAHKGPKPSLDSGFGATTSTAMAARAAERRAAMKPRIMEMRAEGMTKVEIGLELNISDNLVRRILDEAQGIAGVQNAGRLREEAVARAKRALDEFVIEGIATTIPFHKRVLDNEVFLAGDATTDFIETQMGDVL